MITPDDLNKHSSPYLPGHLGMVITHIDGPEVRGELLVEKHLMAPNDFLHAGTVVTLADTCSGHGCMGNLPQKAMGFTTIELKSNFLGTARQGVIQCTAKAVHMGKQTQVWDARVIHKDTGKSIALFRCTQMILYP